MPRLSKLLEKIEDLATNRWGSWYERNKARVPLYAVLGGLGWYFYGMLLNSLRLGKESVFHMTRLRRWRASGCQPLQEFLCGASPPSASARRL